MNLYTYKISNIYVYDGDTITADIDLGFKMSFRAKIRLKDIDTPELRGAEKEEGRMVRDWLRGRIELGIENKEEFYIRTYKDRTGKYGRYLGYFFIGDENINETLIFQDMAVPFMV